ncbi:spastin-like [Dermacentor andersoni]|uniref:spastin-like n=1 Tax=Dermacentor andersoni TaxID=34620 RepID=UPI003B39FC69
MAFGLLRWLFAAVVAALRFALRGVRSDPFNVAAEGQLSAPANTCDAAEEPDVELLIRLNKHNKRALQYLRNAIAYDEENGGPTWEWANTLKEKMRANLEIAQDRLDFLETMVKIQHLGDHLPWHAGVARRQATPKRRQWEKVARKGAVNSDDGPSWLKRAMNGVRMTSQARGACLCFGKGAVPPPYPPWPVPARRRLLPWQIREASVVSALKGADSQLAHIILEEIVDGCPEVLFSDIAGQKEAKQLHTGSEERILVMGATSRSQELDAAALRHFKKWVYVTRLDVNTRMLFPAICAPPKGLLRIGPSGNGKIIVAKALPWPTSATAHASTSVQLRSLLSAYLFVENLVAALQ